MDADKNLIWIVAGIFILFLIAGQTEFFAVSDYPTSIIREAPDEVSPGEEFEITYKAVNPGTGKWGATIEDEVTGGCDFNGKTEWKQVLLSTEGDTKALTITASNSEGSCTFGGNFKIADLGVQDFQSKTVTITEATQTCSQLGGDICTSTETCSGDWLNADDTNRCCSGNCEENGNGNGDGNGDEDGNEDGEDTEIIKFIKKIGEQFPITKKPLTDGLIILGAAFIIFLIILKMGKK